MTNTAKSYKGQDVMESHDRPRDFNANVEELCEESTV